MAIRKNRAMGFVDCVLAGELRSAELLARLDAATPWDAMAAPIAALPEYTNPGPGGPPGARWSCSSA